MNEIMECFSDLSEDTIYELVKNRLYKKSKNFIKWCILILEEYARKHYLSNLAKSTTTKLAAFLSKFYAEVRTNKELMYANNAMLG